MLPPGLRKLSLTAHVVFSVGWLGAVTAFLVLAIIGRASGDPERVRAAYVSMNGIGELAIVPLSIAALISGLVQSIGTPWGIFRFYWVTTKLALTIVATILLLLHQFTAVAGAAEIASATALGARPDVGGLGTQLVADAALGLLVLLVNTTLSVFKPWGKTPYGKRKEREASMSGTAQDPAKPSAGIPIGLKVLLAALGVLVTVFAVVHLLGGGLHH